MHIVHRAREILAKPSDNRKQWLDRLFIVHAAFSGMWGSLSFIFPHLIAYLFGEEYHHQLRYNPDAETKVRATLTFLQSALAQRHRRRLSLRVSLCLSLSISAAS